MSFLLDTNVLSELRKGERANANVRGWFAGVDPDDLYLSVLVIGELRQGIESIRRRDARSAARLQRWLAQVVEQHADRVLPIDLAAADAWGHLNVPDRIPVIDGLLAATALVSNLTLVTRNVRDVKRTGVNLLNPFDDR